MYIDLRIIVSMFSTGRQPPTGNARLARLSSRWNDLRAEMDRDKQHRRESLEDQLLMVEDMGNRDAMTLELKIKVRPSIK